jgi:hypothetical protein
VALLLYIVQSTSASRNRHGNDYSFDARWERHLKKTELEKEKLKIAQVLAAKRRILDGTSWTVRFNMAKGRFVYINEETGERRNRMPNVYEYRQENNEEIQSDLLPGWKRYLDPDSGDYYYHDPKTGKTQWEKPQKVNHDSQINETPKNSTENVGTATKTSSEDKNQNESTETKSNEPINDD